jgi:uncharacterized protein YbbC (DUF1343 family)
MKKLFVFLLIIAQWNCTNAKQQQTRAVSDKPIAKSTIGIGAEQLDEYLPLLANKNVGLVVNHTTMVGETHLVDLLLKKGVKIKSIFAPEHGFRGLASAGEKIKDEKDPQTGLPLVSLYGKNRKPTPEQLAGLDVVIFDIQDVGVRYYTYLGTLHYVMEACAENNKQVIVFDRPNPNGHYVDGPVLDMKFTSFVGMHPVPVVHGMTVGEYAQMINGEKWLKDGKKCDLKVIKCKDYTHDTPFVAPIKTSPNLPNGQSVLLYPSICIFEGTIISLGRGTDTQFQVIGGPDFKYGDYQFTPEDKPGAVNPPNEGKLCYGYDLRNVDAKDLKFSYKYWIDFYNKAPDKKAFYLPTMFIDKLSGSDQIRKMIAEGKTEEQIKAWYKPELDKYKEMRKKYLLYL